jgi:hypothetical protein
MLDIVQPPGATIAVPASPEKRSMASSLAATGSLPALGAGPIFPLSAARRFY